MKTSVSPSHSRRHRCSRWPLSETSQTPPLMMLKKEWTPTIWVRLRLKDSALKCTPQMTRFNSSASSNKWPPRWLTSRKAQLLALLSLKKVCSSLLMLVQPKASLSQAIKWEKSLKLTVSCWAPWQVVLLIASSGKNTLPWCAEFTSSEMAMLHRLRWLRWCCAVSCVSTEAVA